MEELPRKSFRTHRRTPMRLDEASQRMHDDYVETARRTSFLSSLKYNLSISHSRKFLWFRVPKAGTRTIFQHFHRFKVPLDVVHAMRIHYPTGQYQGYFKFAFIRDPWPRLLSCWRNKIIQSNYFELDEATRERLQDFESFLGWIEQHDIRLCDHHFRLQCCLVDLSQVDFLGRMERFEADFAHICKRLAIPCDSVPRSNQSLADPDADAQLKSRFMDRVRDLYCIDYQIFGY